MKERRPRARTVGRRWLIRIWSLDDSDLAYPLRVHLPLSSPGDYEKDTRDASMKHKHREARVRGVVQLRLLN